MVTLKQKSLAGDNKDREGRLTEMESDVTADNRYLKVTLQRPLSVIRPL